MRNVNTCLANEAPAPGCTAHPILRLMVALLCLLIALPALGQDSEAKDALPSIDSPLRSGQSASADTAVVIGFEQYPYLKLPVPYAGRDARAFMDFLVYTRGVPKDRIELIDSADRAGIERALREAGSRLGEGGTVWVYFAGHGAASPDTGERLLLADDVRSDPDDFVKSGVPLASVPSLVGAGDSPVVMIIDACYTGTARSGKALIDGGRMAVPGRHLTALRQTALWTAASADQVAGPLNPAEHGAFTYFAIGALRGWADGELSGRPDGQVTADEAQAYVSRALRSADLRSQDPQLVVQDPSGWVLSSGAKEQGPELALLRATLDSYGGDLRHEWDIDYGEDIYNEITEDSGYLFITVEPSSATIFINGEEVGSGVYQGERPTGRYRVVAQLGELYYPESQDVVLETGKTKLDLQLDPAFGALHVTSDPSGAEVWLDGEHVGSTPWSKERKKSGAYDLRVALAGHLSDTRSVNVKNQETAEIHALLEPNWGSLEVRSDPLGAAISLDGEGTGKVTPYRFERMAVGVAEVRLSLDGYGEAVQRPVVERKETATVEAPLQPKLGLLWIQTTYKDGTPCEGTVTVDGQPQSDTTPMKLELPAREYEVIARCGDNMGSDRVRVVHGDKVTLDMPVLGGTNFYRGENIVNKVTNETGFMMISVQPPDATIYLNGEDVGQGTVQLERGTGDYVVTAELGDMYHPARQEVALSTGTEKIALQLMPAFGAFEISSSPTGASVYLDDRLLGTTPHNATLRSYDYRLKVVKEDYVEHIDSISIEDNKTLALNLSLEPDWGELDIASTPPGAAITIDGEPTGEMTPHRFDHMLSGYTEVALTMDGYGDAVATPEILRQHLNEVDVSLQPKLGMLVVMAQQLDGTPCEGQIAIDGILRASTTPFKEALTAREHEVQVRCGDGAARESVLVEHNERAAVNLIVKPGVAFDARLPDDVLRMRRRKVSAGVLITGGLVGGGGYVTSAVLYSILAKDEEDRFISDKDSYNRLRSLQIGSMGVGVVGTVVGVAGGIGLLSTLGGQNQVAVGVEPGSGIIVIGRF